MIIGLISITGFIISYLLFYHLTQQSHKLFLWYQEKSNERVYGLFVVKRSWPWQEGGVGQKSGGENSDYKDLAVVG